MTIPLPPYEAPYKPVPQVTPFTYRDGVTMLKKIELLQRYINRELVPFVNDNMEELGDAFETQVNALIEAVNAAIDIVLEAGVEVSDPIMALIFQNASSATRVITDALYATKGTEATVATHTSQIGTLTTNLSALTTTVANLTTTVGLKENITDHNTDITGLTNRINRFARSVKEFGAIGNGTTDDTVALQAAINSGYPLYWGGPDDVYKITASLIRTLTKPLVWRSDGATIKVDSVSSIFRAVDITTPGFDVTIEGPLTIDANLKAFTAWWIYNNTTTFCDVTLTDVAAKNVHRLNTSMTGGDGIHVRGSFTTVNINQPDVRNVTMAAGAGVSGSQGVCGITVSSAAAGMAPKEISIINPFIENIYSLDEAWLVDQDGIRIFTEEDSGSVVPFETHFNIRGGKIKNCGGRSIKSQAEFGLVDGVMFMRRAAPFASRTGTMPEIDFQVGGGIVNNCEFQYVSNTPSRAIQWTGTRQVGSKYTTGVTVTNCKVTYSGSQSLDRFISASLSEQARGVIVVENVEVVNYTNYLLTAFCVIAGSTTSQEIVVRMLNVTAPLDTGLPFLNRTGVATPTFANLHNLCNVRAGGIVAAFSTLATAGSYTQVTSGSNVRVA